MVRRIVYIVFALVALAGFAFAIVTMVSTDLGVAEPEPQPAFPEGNNSQGLPTPLPTDTFEVSARDGIKLRVHDVRKDAVLKGTDPDSGESYYMLLDEKKSLGFDSKGYVLAFAEDLESFNIAVYREPADILRKTAEEDLLGRLALSKNDFCRLRFYISVSKDDGSFMTYDTPSLCGAQ